MSLIGQLLSFLYLNYFHYYCSVYTNFIKSLSAFLMPIIDHHIYSITVLTFAKTGRSNDYLNVLKNCSTKFLKIPSFFYVVRLQHRCLLRTDASFDVSNLYVLLCISGRRKMAAKEGH